MYEYIDKQPEVGDVVIWTEGTTANSPRIITEMRSSRIFKIHSEKNTYRTVIDFKILKTTTPTTIIPKGTTLICVAKDSGAMEIGKIYTQRADSHWVTQEKDIWNPSNFKVIYPVTEQLDIKKCIIDITSILPEEVTIIESIYEENGIDGPSLDLLEKFPDATVAFTTSTGKYVALDFGTSKSPNITPKEFIAKFSKPKLPNFPFLIRGKKDHSCQHKIVGLNKNGWYTSNKDGKIMHHNPEFYKIIPTLQHGINEESLLETCRPENVTITPPSQNPPKAFIPTQKEAPMNNLLNVNILEILRKLSQTDLEKSPSIYAFFYNPEGEYTGTAAVASESEAKSLLQKPELLGYTMRIYSFSNEFTTKIPVVSTIKQARKPRTKTK